MPPHHLFGSAIRQPFLGMAMALLALVSPASAMETYWTEPGFDAYPPKGPEAALGLVIWNHGVKGKEVQYRSAPPLLVQGLAARGWDVIKLNRNPLWENTWENAGQLHIARLVEEVAIARAKGYHRIIVGGQSYGGAIALAAGGRVDGLWAVVATAPGTGQQTIDGIPTDKWSDSIARQTYGQLRALHQTRVAVVFPKEDEYVSIPRGAKARTIFAERGDLPFVLVDESSPIKTHGGAYSVAFNPYASCIGYFLDPASELKSGEFRCAHDEFAATGRAIAAAKPGALAGGGKVWFGYFTTSGQEVVVTVHDGGAAPSSTVEYAWGRGVLQKFNAGAVTVPAEWNGESLSFRLSNGASLAMNPAAEGGMALTFAKTGQAPLSATLFAVQP